MLAPSNPVRGGGGAGQGQETDRPAGPAVTADRTSGVQPGGVRRGVGDLDVVRRGPGADPLAAFRGQVRGEVVADDRDAGVGRVEGAQVAAELRELRPSLDRLDVAVKPQHPDGASHHNRQTLPDPALATNPTQTPSCPPVVSPAHPRTPSTAPAKLHLGRAGDATPGRSRGFRRASTMIGQLRRVRTECRRRRRGACPGWPRCGWSRCGLPGRSRRSAWRPRGPGRGRPRPGRR